MKTANKTIVVIIDAMPLSSPEAQPIFVLNDSRYAGDLLPGYHRFRAEIDVPFPVAEYTEVPGTEAKSDGGSE